MHFEILVEDISGKELLEIIIPRIVDTALNTYKIISYKGLGRLPKNLRTSHDPSKRILLEQLPRLLRGYGKSFTDNEAVIVIVDNDKRTCTEFKKELMQVLISCNPAPKTSFRIAIEEIEAWILGDRNAVKKAYPRLDNREYDTYEQDSITGTWEKLADITLSPNAGKALKKAPYIEIGRKKTEWAKNIGVHMDVHNNASPSFNCFKLKLEEWAEKGNAAP